MRKLLKCLFEIILRKFRIVNLIRQFFEPYLLIFDRKNKRRLYSRHEFRTIKIDKMLNRVKTIFEEHMPSVFQHFLYVIHIPTQPHIYSVCTISSNHLHSYYYKLYFMKMTISLLCRHSREIC